jgi:hypothetical protein
MPIIAEHILDPSPQDKEDLLKIYQDYPFPLTEEPEQWLKQQLQNQSLWAGRFNDRLLVAATVDAQDKQWTVNHLCVRKLTRRRGTASQFLTLLTQNAKQQLANLSINTALAPDILEPLAENCGFTQQADFLWQK